MNRENAVMQTNGETYLMAMYGFAGNINSHAITEQNIAQLPFNDRIIDISCGVCYNNSDRKN
jgi:hypothetical protein